jgi:hypothetical protein
MYDVLGICPVTCGLCPPTGWIQAKKKLYMMSGKLFPKFEFEIIDLFLFFTFLCNQIVLFLLFLMFFSILFSRHLYLMRSPADHPTAAPTEYPSPFPSGIINTEIKFIKDNIEKKIKK